MNFIRLMIAIILFGSGPINAHALGCSENEYDNLMSEMHQIRMMEDLLKISINNSSETTQAVQFSKDLQRLDEHLSDVIKRLNEGCSNN